MKILGIDPSLTGTGIVLLEKGEILKQGVIVTKPTGPKAIDELQRLQKILMQIPIIDADYAVIEGLAMMARNSTALVQLSGLNYLIRHKCQQNNVPFIVVPPTMLKKFVVGRGNSPKDVVLVETYRRYGVLFHDNNLADAYILARIGEALNKRVTGLIKPQQEVLTKLRSLV